MRTTLTILLVLTCSLAGAGSGSWSVIALHEGPGVTGQQNVLQTSLAGPQLVISLEVSEGEPHAKGRWFLHFSTREPVTGFRSVTATAPNNDGPTYVWPVEVLNEATIIPSNDGSTKIVVEVSYDGISTIKAAEQLLFSHSDDNIEKVALWQSFDGQFDAFEAGIHNNEQGLALEHLTVDSYDRNHLPLAEVPKGVWPPASELERARTHLGLTVAEIQAMSWYDIESKVFDREMEAFEQEQEAFDAEQAELQRRGAKLKLRTESFAFPEPDSCTEPAAPASFATAEQAQQKTTQINDFAHCLRGNAGTDIDAFGRLVTEAGGTLDPETLAFDVEGAYFTYCNCIEAFVAIRDQFYQRNAALVQRWEAFQQSVAHLYEMPAQ